jgi:hypothetical protein
MINAWGPNMSKQAFAAAGSCFSMPKQRDVIQLANDQCARYPRDGQTPYRRGFTDSQAEALKAAVKSAVDVDLSNLVSKTDLAELELRLIKWVIGSVLRQLWRSAE